MNFNIDTALLCEEVRKEATGKDAVLGLVPNGLYCPDFPASIRAAFWLSVDAADTPVGNHLITLELQGDNDPMPVATFIAPFAINIAGAGKFALHTYPIVFFLTKPGIRKLSWKLDDGEKRYIRDIPFSPMHNV
ncbi:hypothetical protein [Asaia bogorensis]|uniref:hypothetical protein n=1 Tax=Asaia bogorensis TaxID=91915 RepID=UPI00285713DD|nr:hypothetical protein [Asaia bogorensis]MDR6182058.1 hypothetical protein [Asaia bogorensis NBRC 16594]